MGIFDWLFGGGESDSDKRRRRQAQKEAKSAMDLYKSQQAESEKAINERKAQQAIEKRAINEKQIRSMQASYRRPGIMATARPPTAPVGSMQPMEQSGVGK